MSRGVWTSRHGVMALLVVALVTAGGAIGHSQTDDATGSWYGTFDFTSEGWAVGLMPDSHIRLEVDGGGATVRVLLGVQQANPDTGGERNCVLMTVEDQRIPWVDGQLAGSVDFSAGGGEGTCDPSMPVTLNDWYQADVEARLQDDGTMAGVFWERFGPERGTAYPFTAIAVEDAPQSPDGGQAPPPAAPSTPASPTTGAAPTMGDLAAEGHLWETLAGVPWITDQEAFHAQIAAETGDWSDRYVPGGEATRVRDGAARWFDAAVGTRLTSEDRPDFERRHEGARLILLQVAEYAGLRRTDGTPVFPSLRASLPIIGRLAVAARDTDGDFASFGRFISLVMRQDIDHTWRSAP